MQHDIKLPPEQRRNYKHAIDGFVRVIKEDGAAKLFSGASTASTRGGMMTIGQLSFYDQIKLTLLGTGLFNDNISTHFTASASAGAISTFLTQPLDVLKTRLMNAKPGEYKSVFDCIRVTSKGGPLAFYKGFFARSDQGDAYDHTGVPVL
ncbi:hypothetical protein NQ317_015822 [Molorchus minor]|uniref:Mitochondrial dicarboxylate carrier n=1 Tax=Molorchus minor TaxID=1323400 RepID=A0ABQ9JN21_9CUCU|nr:hypothetical protein NQ317_015822 [Molorchus minor]